MTEITNVGANKLITYSEGSDTVTGVETGDTLVFNNANIDSDWYTTVIGNDVLFYEYLDRSSTGEYELGRGIVLKDAASKKFTAISADGKTLWNVPAGVKLDKNTEVERIINFFDGTNIDAGSSVLDLEFENKYDYNLFYNNNRVFKNVSVKTGEGTDHIEFYGKYVTLDGGAGNDTIEGNLINVSVNAGDGDDLIMLESYTEYDNVTIVGGKGNDTVDNANFYGRHIVYEYASGDGNDVITGYSGGANAPIFVRITNGTSSASNINGDFVIKVGAGSLNFQDAESAMVTVEEKNKFYLYLPDGDKYVKTQIDNLNDTSRVYNGKSNTVIKGAGGKPIDNYGSNVTINSGTDGGAIQNIYGSNVLINADAGRSVYNLGSNVTIIGGADNSRGWLINSGSNVLIKGSFSNGSDIGLTNYGSNVTIQADENNNRINNFRGSNVVISADEGDDTINLSTGSLSENVLIKYREGDGNDVIIGYNSSDTVAIDGEYTTLERGDDVIINVGAGSIVLRNAADVDLNIMQLEEADTMKAGIEYNPKKPTVLNITNPFKGTVDAPSISNSIKTINAVESSKALVLKGGDNGVVINAGSGESTLIGGAKDDKLYGGSGVNTFVYTVGKGKDAVFNYETQDIVSIGGATFDKMSFVDKNNVVTIKFDDVKNAQLSVSKTQTDGAITFDIGGEKYTYGERPEGVTFDDNKKRTALIVGAEAKSGVIVNAADIVSTAKTIDGSGASAEVRLIGNDNANVIKAGNYGSTLYGGNSTKAVADKLYGSTVEAADVFVWSTLDGADVIYNFDGRQGDKVVLEGVTSIDAAKDVKVSATKVEVTINKKKLTLDNPNGEINFVDSDGNALYTTGFNFPSGVGYNAKKTAIMVSNDASNVAPIDLSDPKYLSTVKEIDATAYGGAINLVGNGQSNVLRAGSGGSTLNGGYGIDNKGKPKATSDKLYGSTVGADVFVWDASVGGSDQIFNYNQANGDIISITGDGTIAKSNFKISGKNVVLTAGKNKLTLNEAAGKPIVAVHDGERITYASLPGGVGYNAESKNKLMTIGGAFEGTFDVTEYDYYGTVATLDASKGTNEIELIGNKKIKAIVGGAGKTTMRGSIAADNFYAGTGSDVIVYENGDGKDVVYKFDSSTDVIRLSDATVAATDFVEKGKDIVLTVGKGSITFKNAPRGAITVEQGDETLTYKTLPTGVTYKYNANKKFGTVTIGKNFSGTLTAAELGLPVNEINATAVKTLKLELGGALTSGTLKGSNVELKTMDGTVTIKGVVNKELSLINGDVTEKYKFTKTATTLADALMVESAGQLSSTAEDYWFMQSASAIDELSDITAPSAPCVLDEPTTFARPSLDAGRMLTFNRKK